MTAEDRYRVTQRPASSPALVVENVDISYSLQDGSTLDVVQRVSFTVAANEFVAMVGKSGCGKSSLALAIAGLVEINGGRILVQGEEVENRPSKSVGVVFQHPQLLPWLTVLGNVMFALGSLDMTKDAKKRIAENEIRRVGLSDFAHRYPGQLSGGMQQRVNLARALAANVDVLVLDEPLAALDAFTRDAMQQELLKIWQDTGKAVLFITHQIDEALYLADRVIVLSDRPGNIKAFVDVPFSRPRGLTIKRTQDFLTKENEVWSYLGFSEESETASPE